MGSIAGNLESVWQRIEKAAASFGRDSEDVKLVAVSKGRSPEAVLEAVRAGQYVFGENRAQEFHAKIERVETDLEWHFIGHLQRNKVNMVVGKVALIHSVDSRRLLEAVAAKAGELEIIQDILLQINVSGEESKYGMEEGEVKRMLAAAQDLPGVRVRGLMTIAPLGSPQEARPCFRRLRELEEELEQEYPAQGIDILSMGMTQDFEVALEEGANMVRIGTAIFAT